MNKGELHLDLKWSKRIQKTAGSEELGTYVFTQLVLTEKEYIESNDNDVDWELVASNIGVDFISIQRNGSIEFQHVTDPEMIEVIKEQGLIYDRSFVHDLGCGVYGYLFNGDAGDIAMDNIKTYLENNETEDLAILTIDYDGEYLECIYGEGHEGYIVIPNDLSPTNIRDIEEINILDFINYRFSEYNFSEL